MKHGAKKRGEEDKIKKKGERENTRRKTLKDESGTTEKWGGRKVKVRGTRRNERGN